MPDQEGGKLSTESLSTEQSSQRKPAILNNTASGTSGWKSNFLKWMGNRSPSPAPSAIAGRRPPTAKEGTPLTMWGSANPGVQGGMVRSAAYKAGKKPDKTLAEKMQPEATTKGPVTQPIANPGSSQHNQPEGQAGPFTMPKEASMEAQREKRIDQARTILKFAACMRKTRKKKKLRKQGEETPGLALGGPLGAAGLGAGATAASGGMARNLPKIIAQLDKLNPGIADKLLGGIVKAPAGVKSMINELGGGSRLATYAKRPAMAGAALGLPALAGARAAKREGGAGRGAGAGAIAGVGAANILPMLAALISRKPGALKGSLSGIGRRTAVGAGVGAGAGAVGGAVQKKKRTKAKEKAEGGDKKEKKEAALRKVVLKKKAELKKQALPWGKILGYGALGAGALGAGTGALAVGPPLLRGAQHHISMMADPMYKQEYDWKKMMYSPQMMMLNMLRSSGLGGRGGMPPQLSPEDQQMFQHATYLQGLRAKTKALREAFGA
jgi:hypothetical protein